MVVPDGRMTLCRPRRRHAGDGLERMRVRFRYWKANRSVARVEEVVEVRANGPLERTAHRRSRAAGAAPPPARRRGRRPRPGGQSWGLRAGAGGAPRPAARAWPAAPGCTFLPRFLPRPRDARAARPAAPAAPPRAGGERGRGPPARSNMKRRNGHVDKSVTLVTSR